MSDDPPTDRRITRTRIAIRNALVALIDEKGFDAITVSDITARAGINRGTFYLHYQDKYELLERTTDEVVQDIENLVVGAKPLKIANYTSQPLPILERIFHYIKAEESLIRALLRLSGANNFITKIRGVMEKNLILGFNDGQKELDLLVPKEYLVAYIMHAHLGIVQTWVESGCQESPQEMAVILSQLSMYGPFRAIGFVAHDR